MLAMTIVIMGLGTFLIGLLPTYDQISIFAPVLLVLLRLLEGIGLGGEWGGAVLMVVENAPGQKSRTSRFDGSDGLSDWESRRIWRPSATLGIARAGFPGLGLANSVLDQHRNGRSRLVHPLTLDRARRS
jgi:MFS family permease